jgi:hypothetical protein
MDGAPATMKSRGISMHVKASREVPGRVTDGFNFGGIAGGVDAVGRGCW